MLILLTQFLILRLINHDLALIKYGMPWKRKQKMDSIQIIVIAISLFVCLWRVVNWIWFKPKKLEKLLREQGLKGNSYRILYGDTKEFFQTLRIAGALVHWACPFYDSISRFWLCPKQHSDHNIHLYSDPWHTKWQKSNAVQAYRQI